MATAKELKIDALKSIERVLTRVNSAHDKSLKGRTSSNINEKFNEEEELFQLQNLLYNFRSRLKE